jgi:hypothetical protein
VEAWLKWQSTCLVKYEALNSNSGTEREREREREREGEKERESEFRMHIFFTFLRSLKSPVYNLYSMKSGKSYLLGPITSFLFISHFIGEKDEASKLGSSMS